MLSHYCFLRVKVVLFIPSLIVLMKDGRKEAKREGFCDELNS
jgi:hypothetical protein